MPTGRVAEWLNRLAEDVSAGLLFDLLLLGLLALAVAAAVHFVRRAVDRYIDDVNQRHRVRKWIGYGGTVLVLVVGLALLVGRALHVTALLGILGAGAAIALQDVAKNAIGWIYISGRAGLGPGARVQVEGVEGEVIDVGVLKTTLLEVGGRVHGQQSSGRVASVPNSRFLNQAVLFSPDFSPHVWQELQFLLTFESDWKRGVEVLREVGDGEHREVAAGARRGFEEMERRFAFKYGALTPIVYLHVADSGIQLTLRYLTHIRQARGSADRVGRAMLEAVGREPDLEFAYPTWRVYRRGEPVGGPGGEPGAG